MVAHLGSPIVLLCDSLVSLLPCCVPARKRQSLREEAMGIEEERGAEARSPCTLGGNAAEFQGENLVVL